MLHSPLVSSVLNTNNIPKNVTSNILAKFSNLICEIQSSNARIVNPNKLKEAINKSVPQFADFDQHDAQEFLTFLLSTLNEEMKELINENTKEPFIHKLMYGSIQSTCVCQKCKNASTLEEEFSTLNLPLPQSVKQLSRTAIIWKSTRLKDRLIRQLNQSRNTILRSASSGPCKPYLIYSQLAQKLAILCFAKLPIIKSPPYCAYQAYESCHSINSTSRIINAYICISASMIQRNC
jgi:hypothetical protein